MKHFRLDVKQHRIVTDALTLDAVAVTTPDAIPAGDLRETLAYVYNFWTTHILPLQRADAASDEDSLKLRFIEALYCRSIHSVDVHRPSGLHNELRLFEMVDLLTDIINVVCYVG